MNLHENSNVVLQVGEAKGKGKGKGKGKSEEDEDGSVMRMMI